MILVYFVTTALLVISLITLSNVLIMPRLRQRQPERIPLVSIMVPARNEAAVIRRTVQHLSQQDYPNYELIVLDDNSTDGTDDIARQHGARVIAGQPLAPGWMGKNWACHQMQAVASGDILVFTDADVVWNPGALATLVSQMERTKADLYTVWPTQHTETWAERLCVPLMAVVVMGYLPVIGTHYVPLSAFGAANGQCMIWRREAYDHLGGHAAVHDNVLEDVTMGRMVKGSGMRLRMADGNHLIQCRMYSDWPTVRDGYAKNILAGYGSVPALLLATVFHWMIFLLPWLWLVTGPANWALALIVMGLTVRALTAAFTHQRVLDALLMPVSVLLMTRIAAQSLYWHYRHGGPQWKGRVVMRKVSNGR